MYAFEQNSVDSHSHLPFSLLLRKDMVFDMDENLAWTNPHLENKDSKWLIENQHTGKQLTQLFSPFFPCFLVLVVLHLIYFLGVLSYILMPKNPAVQLL